MNKNQLASTIKAYFKNQKCAEFSFHILLSGHVQLSDAEDFADPKEGSLFRITQTTSRCHASKVHHSVNRQKEVGGGRQDQD